MALDSHSFGVCSWSLAPASASELVEAMNRLALKKVQLALDPIRVDPESWKGLPDLLADAGIELVSGMYGTLGEDYTTPQTIKATGGVVVDANWKQNIANIRDNVAIAKELGIRHISGHAGFIPPNQGDTLAGTMAERLDAIAKLFQDELDGVLLLETGQETADTLLAFLDRLKQDNVRVNFDPANMLLYGMGDPIEAMNKLMPHIAQVHIKDAVSPSKAGAWGEEVPAGQGEVDWQAFVKTLKAGNYDGALVIEREAGTTREQDIRQAVAHVGALL